MDELWKSSASNVAFGSLVVQRKDLLVWTTAKLLFSFKWLFILLTEAQSVVFHLQLV